LIYISLVLDVHPEQLCTTTFHFTASPSVIQVTRLQAGWPRKLIWFPAGTRDFYPHESIQTGSGAHLAFYTRCPMQSRTVQ